MTIFATKFLNSWCKFLTVSLGLFCLLTACGKVGGSASSEVSVHLSIPEGENAELFWYGVQNRILKIEKNGRDPISLDWQVNTRIPVDLEEGDILRLQGLDRNLRIVVEGEAKVTKEKNITIPVHRVL